MSAPSPQGNLPEILLPAVPVLAVNGKEAAVLTEDGELQTLPHAAVALLVKNNPPLVCHAPWTAQKLGLSMLPAFDVLELFAFVHPARFCVPTPAGLAKALGLPVPETFEDYPLTLMDAARALLADLQNERRHEKKADPAEIAKVMGLQGQGWPWAPFVTAALGVAYDPKEPVIAKVALNVWQHLPEWAEDPPPVPVSHHPVTKNEALARLSETLGESAEDREAQKEYTARLAGTFAPVQKESSPHIVLAEAGTGVGKTLGYLAPASVWAEKNTGTVWVSTYTKNLQRQIMGELDRLYPDPDVKKAKTAVRKGRENYLCLLNLEDMITGATLSKDARQVMAAGLMARWAEVTEDGDLQGGDFPGWLKGLLGFKYTDGLADRRGECIYAVCDHYHRCFVERSVRKAPHASVVVANHALVMVQTALAGPEDLLPQRYVFDEGHHLFDAADSAFAGVLSARETHDLRRWILGAESAGRRSRARGLQRRVEDLISEDAAALKDMRAVMSAAHELPAYLWSRRLKNAEPEGLAEQFFSFVHNQIQARADGRDGPYSLETQPLPPIEGIADAAGALEKALQDLYAPMKRLAKRLRQKLSDEAQTLESDQRGRLESLSNGLDRRAEGIVGVWKEMLQVFRADFPAENYKEFVFWLEVTKSNGQAADIGLHRRWIDPVKPFAGALKQHAQGVAVTSATLCDHSGDARADENFARRRTGADYLSDSPAYISVTSPFDYAAQTRVFVVDDVNRNEPDQIASAYRVLFEAAGGGALGLFTAINRLRAVYERIVEPLEAAELALYAQHVDAIDTGTLVDIFRDDPHACLLGTDAVRDGVDVPGEALRLLVYDRVPWPRPSILHKARREVFGSRTYDETIARARLRQAYGRLIRRSDDKGVFVMLDSRLPSRLHGAFPAGASVERLGLAAAVRAVQAFLEM